MVFNDQKNPRSGVQTRKNRSQGLRYLGLDLTYEDRQRQFNPDANIGQGFKGSKRHPPSQYSFNHSTEYHQDLQDDVNHIITDEYNAEHGTPKYVMEVNNQVTHSGESPLFLSKLLPANKLEQRHGPIKWNKALLQPNKCSPPLKQNGQTFYRPNSTHQYLTTTDLKNSVMNEVNVQLGKPTRASLLRARHRCSSAPVNAYEKRRQSPRVPPVSRPQSASSGIRRGPQPQVAAGESIHSFLIGARYNNAHYLDSRSLFKFGVYMPRSNPGQTFFVEKLRKNIDAQDSEGLSTDQQSSDQYTADQYTPGTPHESTCSDSDEENSSSTGPDSGHASVFHEPSATYPPIYDKYSRINGSSKTEAGQLSGRHDASTTHPHHPHPHPHLSQHGAVSSVPNIPGSFQDNRKRPSSARNQSKKNLFLLDLPEKIRLKGVKVSGSQLKGAKYQKCPATLNSQNPRMNSIEIQGVQASVWTPNTAKTSNTPNVTLGGATEPVLAGVQEKPVNDDQTAGVDEQHLSMPSPRVGEETSPEVETEAEAEECATARGNSMLDYSSVTGGVHANDIGNDLDDLSEHVDEHEEQGSMHENSDPIVITEQLTPEQKQPQHEATYHHGDQIAPVEGAGDAIHQDKPKQMAVEGFTHDQNSAGDLAEVLPKDAAAGSAVNSDNLVFFVTEEGENNNTTVNNEIKHKDIPVTESGPPDTDSTMAGIGGDLADLNQNNNNNNDNKDNEQGEKRAKKETDVSLTIDIDLLTLEELADA